MRHNYKIILLMVLGFQGAYADYSLLQHFRTGVVSGSFNGSSSQGTISGDFYSPLSLDIEFEYFNHSKKSFLARSTLSIDSTSGDFKYINMSIGQKYYVFSQGLSSQFKNDSLSFTIIPLKSYYLSYELGISTVEIEKRTESLSVNSHLLEIGGSAGFLYGLTSSLFLEAQISAAKGIPISPVAVDSLVFKFLLGVSKYF